MDATSVPDSSRPERVCAVDHPVHGTLTVTVRLGEWVSVQGGAVPEVVVRRTGGEPREWIPVGTRDPASVAMTVDGRTVGLTPSKGRIARRSYRVAVDAGEVHWRLRPTDVDESTLWRDGALLGRFALRDHVVELDLADGVDVTAADLAVGCALVAAFGAGALPAWEAFLDVVSGALPF